MGHALAEAALERGHDVVVVSGPVEITYPSRATVRYVVSTEEMLDACRREFPGCEGAIGVAAPCDYRPVKVEDQKMSKTGDPIVLHLIETPDVMATLGAEKRRDQWLVGFALESEDHHFRAITKLQKKRCDLMVLNAPTAISARQTHVEILDPTGNIIAAIAGDKREVARGIFDIIHSRLLDKSRGDDSR
jgi:phosphopantothenoylcysteine decarboxylase/phosphopantothenate--cysteine ligase